MGENVTDQATTRRAVVLGAGGAGLAVALAACGGSGDAGDEAAPKPTGPIAQTADIPEGGGKVFRDQKIVITQPAAGEFKAFSAVCTHRNCLVGAVEDGVIICHCHGSTFDIRDGSVKNGPATAPLPEEKINVTDGGIALA